MTRDRYRYFRVEARELVEGLTRGVLDLEKGRDVERGVREVLRLAHTLKGAARVVGLGAIGELAHALEDCLAEAVVGSLGAERTRQALALLDQVGEALAALPSATATEGAPTPTVRELPAGDTARIELATLDGLLESIHEASLQVLQVRDRVRAGEQQPALDALATLERQLDTLGDVARDLRLRPAGSVFAQLERTARDAAAALGKRVAFQAAGGDVRLDGHVLDGVKDALMHVVNNAVVHGAEPEAERLAGAKAAVASVQLEVAREGARVVFRCRDDGRGIDQKAVLRAAERHGLTPLAADGAPTAAELQTMISVPGLSTAGAITELAGRGVGLDVVRANVARLKGTWNVESTPGQGTLVELTVPVSLSTVPVLYVAAGGWVAAVPMAAVSVALRLPAGEVRRSGAIDTAEGACGGVPWLSLAERLGWSDGVAPETWNVLVIQHGNEQAAMGVERILGAAEVPVRPLPAGTGAQALIAGVTMGPDGVPRPVLDAAGVVAAAHTSPVRRAAPTPAARLPILVVDDSLTTRMLEQTILEAAGYEVELATSGEEGLAMARARRYALLIVDVEMPGMNGFELLARVSADPDLRGVPAMLVTSLADAEHRKRGESVGARAYIAKGEFEQGRFLQAVRELAR